MSQGAIVTVSDKDCILSFLFQVNFDANMFWTVGVLVRYFRTCGVARWDREVADLRDDDKRKREIVPFRVARWQNLIPSFPWIAPGWRAWGRNPRKVGRDQILQRSVAEP